ncbi:hypothetical protein BDP55DRAFT_718334 [Colletotrichum godetiae]|uniref:Uncharacterized protein n=1 Tax=Colletotrichum godetiae TaxID=1209918 RepID=A0AAJ0AF95_9PEZI|nr:uncharacterized protein BDP55DRAFT_718334 [Colletotrichum godetiae]KAK1672215.1 hypothetical protein BDP55DRAFT_718334 [Colletotrichum godetiae]
MRTNTVPLHLHAVLAPAKLARASRRATWSFSRPIILGNLIEACLGLPNSVLQSHGDPGWPRLTQTTTRPTQSTVCRLATGAAHFLSEQGSHRMLAMILDLVTLRPFAAQPTPVYRHISHTCKYDNLRVVRTKPSQPNGINGAGPGQRAADHYPNIAELLHHLNVGSLCYTRPRLT